MKIILGFIAVLAAIGCDEISAQQLAPSSVPARDIPTPASTPEPPAPPPVASAPPRAEAVRTPEPERTPAPEPHESAASAPGFVERLMGRSSALKRAERRWAEAIAKHDYAALESLLARDFVGVNDKGKVQSRRALLAELKNDRDTYRSVRSGRLEVHMFGATFGVVVGTFRAEGRSRDGQEFDRTYRFTDTWMLRNGQWQCVASQNMLVSPK